MHSPANSGFARPNPVRALIFDMDGTILDTRAYHMAAWREMVRRHNLTPAHYRVAETGFGVTNWSIFNTWFGATPNGWDYEALSEEKEALFRELIAGKERPRAGMLELLGWARRRNVFVGLATSGPRSNAEFLLEDAGIARYFDAVLWGDAQIRSKPHPEPFLRVAARLGVRPQQAVVFEDSRHGFLSAARAGMRLVGIAERPEELGLVRRWTAHVFLDFRGVPELLERWMRDGERNAE